MLCCARKFHTSQKGLSVMRIFRIKTIPGEHGAEAGDVVFASIMQFHKIIRYEKMHRGLIKRRWAR